MPITVQGFHWLERKGYYLKKNQCVSYSVLLWKGRMNIDSSKGRMYLQGIPEEVDPKSIDEYGVM